jgi:hypothetical protein
MSLHVELDCPQCGAPLEMKETDRLLHCKYCEVSSYLANTDHLHFILPRQKPDPFTLYAPFLHFKGIIYTCVNDRIEHRIADISTRGVNLSFLPSTLGLRPQAMKMRFVTPELDGSFLKCSMQTDTIIKRAEKNLAVRDENVLHRAFIGEALNIIYLPLSIKDETVIDGIVDRPLTQIPEDHDLFAETDVEKQRWKPVFVPSLCPQCGWNLTGEPDSVVLICSNCNSAWETIDNRFSEVEIRSTPRNDEEDLFIPFWKIKVIAHGSELETFGDFIRLTNQPMIARPEWDKTPLQFIIPAFKIRPDDFLRLSTQMTVSQKNRIITKPEIPIGKIHPVTLPQSEAAQSLKVILANSAVSKNRVFPHLHDIDFEVQGYSLHYLPFHKTTHELRQEHLRVTINQRVLEFGRSL